MNIFRITVLIAVAALPAGGATDFSRYAPILERRPFSSPIVEDVQPAPVALVAPPAFVQDLRMVAITESPAGTRVGVVNIREKPPKAYYLYIGDMEDGILLVEADFNGERALLRKDGEQFWVTMGEGTADPSSTAPKPTAVPSPVEQPMAVLRADGGSPTVSYAERRRQRLEEMRRRAQESRNLSEEDVEKRLREYQMKLIREGKTPLPIPITEEMDAQLVKEGILPSVD